MMKKTAAILAALVLTFAFPMTTMAATGASPSTDSSKVSTSTDSDRTSPATGEAPVTAVLAATAAAASAGIVLCLKKREQK